MLNRILQNITNNDDWEILASLCEYNGEFTLDELTQAGKIKAIKKQITANFNTSDFSEKEVYYDQLLVRAAKILEIKPLPKNLCNGEDIEIIERLILGEYIKKVKNACIQEQGYSFWNEKESLAFRNLKKLSYDLAFTGKEIAEINEFQNNFDSNLMASKISTLIFILVVMEILDLNNISTKNNIEDKIKTISSYTKWLLSVNPLWFLTFVLTDAVAKAIVKLKITTNTIIFLAILHLKQINADRLKKIIDDN